jgi:hypothetical protein
MSSRKFKVLALENSFLKEKLNMLEEQHVQCSIEFHKAFKKFADTLPKEEKELVLKIQKTWDDNMMGKTPKKQNKPEQQSQQNINTEQKTIEAKKKDNFFKETYKNIAKVIHPDKLLNLEGKEKEEKTKLLERTQAAMNKEDISELIEIADELNVEVANLSAKEIKALKNANDDINKKINDLQKTVAWTWYHTEGFDKNKIMIHYVQYIAENFVLLKK